MACCSAAGETRETTTLGTTGDSLDRGQRSRDWQAAHTSGDHGRPQGAGRRETTVNGFKIWHAAHPQGMHGRPQGWGKLEILSGEGYICPGRSVFPKKRKNDFLRVMHLVNGCTGHALGTVVIVGIVAWACHHHVALADLCVDFRGYHAFVYGYLSSACTVERKSCIAGSSDLYLR